MHTITPLMLSDREAATLLGIGRATLSRRVKDCTSPQPVRIGGATRWRRDEPLARPDALSAEREATG